MKRQELEVGQKYRVKLHGQYIVARLDEIQDVPGYKSPKGTYKTKAKTRYQCTNLNTGRKITIKSAVKFLGKADQRIGVAPRSQLTAEEHDKLQKKRLSKVVDPLRKATGGIAEMGTEDADLKLKKENPDRYYLWQVARCFKGIRQEDLMPLEKRVARWLVLADVLKVDGQGGFEIP